MVQKLKNFKGNWRNMSKTKKFLLIMAFSFVTLSFIGGGVALWMYSFNDVTGLTISSDVPITFSSDFSITPIDTTNNSYGKTETITITNQDSNISLIANISVTQDDVTGDSCIIDSGGVDVTNEVRYDGNPINNNDTLIVTNGVHYVDVDLNASWQSCPQNYSVEITLS